MPWATQVGATVGVPCCGLREHRNISAGGHGDTGGRWAAVIAPAQHLIDAAGASMVFEIEIERLKAARLSVVLVIIHPRLSFGPVSAARRLALTTAGRNLGADDVIILDSGRSIGAMLGLFQVWLASCCGDWTIETDALIARCVNLAGLYSLRDRPIDVVVCNYLSGTKAAAAIAPPEQNILVLHDITDQPLSGRVKQAVSNAGRLICLNADEAKYLSRELGGVVCHFGVPVAKEAPVNFEEVVRYRDLSEILSDAEPIGNAVPSPRAGSTLDLLFVGGRHPPNVSGLRAFIRQCFLPHLASRGVSLVVAGDVAADLGEFAEHDGIILLGRVGHLRPLYAAARLVIAPLTEGSGVSIKVVEPLCLGKPVVSTLVGLRGLNAGTAPRLDVQFDRWAEPILKLLTNIEARRKWRDQMCAAINISDLADILGQSISAVRDQQISIPSAATRPVATEQGLVEWWPDLPDVFRLLSEGGGQETSTFVEGRISAVTGASAGEASHIVRMLRTIAARQ